MTTYLYTVAVGMQRYPIYAETSGEARDIARDKWKAANPHVPSYRVPLARIERIRVPA